MASRHDMKKAGVLAAALAVTTDPGDDLEIAEVLEMIGKVTGGGHFADHLADLVGLVDGINELRRTLSILSSFIASVIDDAGWRPTVMGDDVVVVSYPKPSTKCHDADAFWGFMRQATSVYTEVSLDGGPAETAERTVRLMARLFNPNGIRIGAFKAEMEALGHDPGVIVDTLFPKAPPDYSKPPRVTRIPVSKWPGELPAGGDER